MKAESEDLQGFQMSTSNDQTTPQKQSSVSTTSSFPEKEVKIVKIDHYLKKIKKP